MSNEKIHTLAVGSDDNRKMSVYETKARNAIKEEGITGLLDEDVLEMLSEWCYKDLKGYNRFIIALRSDRGNGKIVNMVEKKVEKQVKILNIQDRSKGNGNRDYEVDRGNPDYRQNWSVNSSGVPFSNEKNIVETLRNAPFFKGAFLYNEFTKQIIVNRPLPWSKDVEEFPRTAKDNDAVSMVMFLHDEGLLDVKSDMAGVCVKYVAEEDHSFNPVKNYLKSLNWDGVGRLKRLPYDLLGTPESKKIAGIFFFRWMISAIARIMQPGCKADYMFILEGEQGFRKSSLYEILGGEYYLDETIDFNDRDGKLALQECWIYEFAELAKMTYTSVEVMKAQLTRKNDRFREMYGRIMQKHPRHFVSGGSMNVLQDNPYLKDETGGRRYWPVKVTKKIDIELLKSMRDQLWAEALHYYTAGEQWYLTDDEEVLAKIEQDARLQNISIENEVVKYLEGFPGQFDSQVEQAKAKLPGYKAVIRTEVSVDEIYKSLFGEHKNAKLESDIGKVLNRLKWQFKRKKFKNALGKEYRLKVYIRPGIEINAEDYANDDE